MNLENKTVAELRKIAADNQVRFEQGTKKKDMINTLEHYMQKIQSQNDEETLFENEVGLQDGLGGTDHIDELYNPDAPSDYLRDIGANVPERDAWSGSLSNEW